MAAKKRGSRPGSTGQRATTQLRAVLTEHERKEAAKKRRKSAKKLRKAGKSTKKRIADKRINTSKHGYFQTLLAENARQC